MPNLWRPIPLEPCVGWGVHLRKRAVADKDLAGGKHHQCPECGERGVEIRSIKLVKSSTIGFDQGVAIGQKNRKRISGVITVGKIGTDSPGGGGGSIERGMSRTGR